MIPMGYKGRSTPQLSSWARFGHTIIWTDFTITRRYHSDSFRQLRLPEKSTNDHFLCSAKRTYLLDLFLDGSRCLP
jgi:hypothetical protein